MILEEIKIVILKPELSSFCVFHELVPYVSNLLDMPQITSLDESSLNNMENLYYNEIIKGMNSGHLIILIKNNYVAMRTLEWMHNRPGQRFVLGVPCVLHEDEELVNYYKTAKVDPIDAKVAELELLLYFPFIKEQHIPIGQKLTWTISLNKYKKREETS